jgi:hypothetical protein
LLSSGFFLKVKIADSERRIEPQLHSITLPCWA